MSYCPFVVERGAFFNREQLASIEEATLRILDDVGIAVRDGRTREQLVAAGFQCQGERIVIGQKRVSEFLDAERARNGYQFTTEPRPAERAEPRLRVDVSPYPQWVHDLESDRLVPFTTERLVEATKLCHALGIAGPPGCPTDVPPGLQPVIQYQVAATFSEQGSRPVDPKSAETLPIIMEMAEVMERPIRSLPIYVFSPLTLESESLRCALAFESRLSSVSISNMPSAGCTAPIHVGDAYALSAAEVIGAAILVSERIDLPVGWSLHLFPIDLRTLAMVFGSPENFLLQLTTSEVNAYFHGTPWCPAAGNIHTNAKLPGAQACSEKASLMSVGALLGARSFGSAGTLSLDEVFSAEQLIYDLEISHHIQRLVKGIDGECDPDRCVRDVRDGVAQRSFVATDATLEGYRDFYWHPDLFNREFVSAWLGSGATTERQKAHASVRESIQRHDYELEPERRRALDGVVAEARRLLVG